MNNPPICVWFKRDLRIEDHAPLYQAAQSGSILPLYIIEPDLFNAPDFGSLHWTFIRACLAELNNQPVSYTHLRAQLLPCIAVFIH